MSNSYDAACETLRIKVEIPSAEDIDFGSAEEIQGYGRLLLSQFRNLNGFSGISGVPIDFIRQAARTLLLRIRRDWSRHSAADLQLILPLLPRLSFISGMTQGVARLEEEMIARLYGRMLAGEAVSLPEMMTEMRRLSPKPAQQRWYGSVRNAWIEEAVQPQPFSRHSAAQAIGIAAFLLSDPLAELGEEGATMKERLKNLIIEKASALSRTKGVKLLQALAAALPLVRRSEARKAYVRVLELLSRDSRINIYLRQSYLLDLTYEK